jgi:hypothetical protein
MSSNNSGSALEPRRDLPLHKIPELLAKITGTLASTTSDMRPSPSTNDRCERLFEQYANHQSVMSLDGILRLCNDLSVEPDSYEVLLFCFLCRAKQMYLLSKDEFLLGLRHVGHRVDNVADLRRALFDYDVLPYEHEFYMWTYQYGLIDGQRCLMTTHAISLWRLFYSKGVQQPTILDAWLNFLHDETINDVPTTITCDTWKIFPQFAKFIESNDFDAYDENEGWPCLFDGFVECHIMRGKNPH